MGSCAGVPQKKEKSYKNRKELKEKKKVEENARIRQKSFMEESGSKPIFRTSSTMPSTPCSQKDEEDSWLKKYTLIREKSNIQRTPEAEQWHDAENSNRICSLTVKNQCFQSFKVQIPNFHVDVSIRP